MYKLILCIMKKMNLNTFEWRQSNVIALIKAVWKTIIQITIWHAVRR